MVMITTDDLQALMAAEANRAVSIFMPTHVAGREIRQDPIRLRKLIEDAAGQLTAVGCRRPEAEALLAPAMRLTEDGDFWRHQDRGLAIFLAPGLFRHFRVPAEFGEKVVVGRHFHLKPLLPLLEAHRRFLVLAISAGRARIFDANPLGMAELQNLSLPAGVAAISAETVYENTRQTNPAPGAGRGGPGGVAKTQNLGEDPEEQRKAQLVEYLRRVASALQQRLAGDRRPIVLAAQPEIQGHFRAIARLASLLPQPLDINPDALDERALHRRAYDLVKPIFDDSRAAAQRQAEQLLGEEDARATADAAEIVAAAHDGRIDTLFLAPDAELWGRYDENRRQVIAHDQRQAEDDDLLDYAATLTLLKGGHVTVMPKTAIPGAGLAAALLRYPI
jgi:hypothetical protein